MVKISNFVAKNLATYIIDMKRGKAPIDYFKDYRKEKRKAQELYKLQTNLKWTNIRKCPGWSQPVTWTNWPGITE